MRKLLLLIGLLFLFIRPIYAAQSTVTVSEGTACMGDDKSRKQTEQAAVIDAKKKAVEFVSTHIKSETNVKNFELEKDLLYAYANAEVKIIQELEKAWYKDTSSGDCYRIKIKAEVIPDTKAMGKLLSDQDKSRSYEFQERCQQRAEQVFKDKLAANADSFKVFHYRCHYNYRLNKCFMLLIFATKLGDPIMLSIHDVNENSIYGYCGEDSLEKQYDCKSQNWKKLKNDTMEE